MSEPFHTFRVLFAYLRVVFSPASSSLYKKTYLVFSAFTSRTISLLTTNELSPSTIKRTLMLNISGIVMAG